MSLFNRTQIFTVYLKPKDRHVADSAEFVSDGFSFAAFIFSWIWAVYHRIWWAAALQLAFVITLPILAEEGMITASVAAIAQFGAQLLLGLESANLRHRALLKRGYVLSDVVAEDSLIHAQQRYFARHASVLA